MQVRRVEDTLYTRACSRAAIAWLPEEEAFHWVWCLGRGPAGARVDEPDWVRLDRSTWVAREHGAAK